ncbi:MAG: hypothetical protein GTO02_22195, partial [Candidatus Dadabacteria bacterium]|nr:hypothetical protein [Candidatus Dadabacteria bacterium]NIQ16992.1 hypothetical protein [Candidatus Dadabacteria bacterium]
ESEISEEESKLSTLTEEYNKKISENEKKIEELKANYDPIKEEKNKLAAKVDPKILPIYERIANRTGEALALAENERCMSCNMNIPPQLFNEVLTQNKIVLCPNCKKILYTSHEEEKT